jgi:lipopolysaccharide transport system permease protein
MMFFVTPVLYPLSNAPGKLRLLLALNPMTGVVEGFRHALLGSPFSWPLIELSATLCFLVFTGGLYFFSRMERLFADLI